MVNIDLAVAINLKKSQRKMITSPILLEARCKFNYEISFFLVWILLLIVNED